MEDLRIYKSSIADEWLVLPGVVVKKTFFGMGYVLAVKWLKFTFGVVWKVDDWQRKASKNYYDNLKKIVERDYQEKHNKKISHE